MGGGGLNVAYLRTADFCGGLKSGLILLTLSGFLDFYSGNTVVANVYDSVPRCSRKRLLQSFEGCKCRHFLACSRQSEEGRF